MKSARVTLPEERAGDVTCGIDWARDDHAVSVVNASGRELHRCSVEHSAAGLHELVAVLARNGAREAAIERPDRPVVDALLSAGITVMVSSPSQVKNLRGRYGSASSKDDRFDVYVLAAAPRSDDGAAQTPEALACLAGAAPSTRQSGKRRAVSFRWACDKQLRDAVTDFAGDSRHASPWTATLYNKARTRGHDHPHAVRILARAWLFVIWPCWQHRTTYDPAKHPALQTLLNQDPQAAA